MFNNCRFLICGGGTGGHLFPATAIMTELSKQGANVLYMGSKHGIEATTIKSDNIVLLDIKGFHRTLSLSNFIDNIKFPFKIIKSVFKSVIIIYKFNPQLIIGTGGYSSGIPLISALILGKKILLQEQNSYPGFTNRILSKFADKICLGYTESRKYFKNNCIFTGNPIRKNLKIYNKSQARNELSINENKFTIFICGGSQGSKPINEYLKKNINFYNRLDANIIWQCGPIHLKVLSSLNINKNIILYDFIKNIDLVYSASDLVISRSGALTLTEINYFGKASILIPFPFSAGNHQYKNAIFSKKSKASIIIEQKDLSNGSLEKTILKLKKSNDEIKKMGLAAKSISTPNSIDNIIKEINLSVC